MVDYENSYFKSKCSNEEIYEDINKFFFSLNISLNTLKDKELTMTLQGLDNLLDKLDDATLKINLIDLENFLTTIVYLLKETNENQDEQIKRFCQILVEHQNLTKYYTVLFKSLLCFFRMMDEKRHIKYDIYCSLLKLIKSYNYLTFVETDIKILKNWFTLWRLKYDEKRNLIKLLVDKFYTCGKSIMGLKLLTNFLKLSSSSKEKVEIDKEDLKSCIILHIKEPENYLFDHLLALPNINTLHNDLVDKLFNIFLKQKLADYVKFYEENKSFIEENAIRTKLVRCSIDESTQCVIVDFCTDRIITSNQWSQISAKLKEWSESLTIVTKNIKDLKDTFEPSSFLLSNGEDSTANLTTQGEGNPLEADNKDYYNQQLMLPPPYHHHYEQAHEYYNTQPTPPPHIPPESYLSTRPPPNHTLPLYNPRNVDPMNPSENYYSYRMNENTSFNRNPIESSDGYKMNRMYQGESIPPHQQQHYEEGPLYHSRPHPQQQMAYEYKYQNRPPPPSSQYYPQEPSYVNNHYHYLPDEMEGYRSGVPYQPPLPNSSHYYGDANLPPRYQRGGEYEQ
ncbi:eukaryotic translation initiation factor 3 subunit M-like isoform X2 [Gordionus sp. m RMFG-2023]|uniref:eukaryotic translation initiation factor 3 subunit M-like isoform X2 n=1 Tax=Gordionus sp. m RMFG-2023 TaxID=3053472 RepID=UPI0031FD47E9